MSTLRQALYGLALLGALVLMIWVQETRIDVAEGKTEQAQDAAKTARDDADRNLKTANTLADSLKQERNAQGTLRAQQDQLRQSLATRERTIEELKRENDELRKWADQPLPDAARRLRERPALTGAAAYRDWLSGRSAVPPAGDKPAQ
ncbi:MAG: LysB family phage lysis regulatory protein [Pseudomonas sp.]|uniref:Rz-like lysis system protein LysB n=1 Tax=Pseudomonas sp. TaxID=306 RepID=UPI00238B724A|nr:Rz-like lysis system protein LysB [Pseudomonas sp.]MDE1910741.1 LysB family phage lysis regulatory protein [Pseudomonas sp.]MDE2035363.1 LysB family phage lysis regulatory protein [Pseudomonas sp.]MDE2190002.1 LysB family phage lysis regulatory protein [Pseudomonas sp.]MDE2555367.1 LysB family phage lysis regulatory protein [Pseudomonas sp.]